MATKQQNQKLREVWRQRLHHWKESGKSLSNWCSLEGIPYHQGIYWKSRLFPEDCNTTQCADQKKFVELCDEESPHSGVSIESAGVCINLNKNFDVETLRRCLSAMRR